jgi:hypothetical protein
MKAVYEKELMISAWAETAVLLAAVAALSLFMYWYWLSMRK